MNAPIARFVKHKRFMKFISGERILPVNYEISLSGVCNAKCPECFYIRKGTTARGYIDTGVIKRALYSMDSLLAQAISWSGGGEPTLHPDFDAIISTAASLNFEQGLFTNAIADVRYDPSVMKWIRITFTGRDISDKNLKQIRRCQRVGICVNDDGSRRTEKIEHAIKLADRAEADYIQIRPALEVNGGLCYITEPKNLPNDRRIIITDYKYTDCGKRHRYNKCYGYHFVPFIWDDGAVSTCGYMKEQPEYIFGNIYNEPLEEIIQRFPASMPVIDKCQICCKNHEINKFLNCIFNTESSNFL